LLSETLKNHKGYTIFKDCNKEGNFVFQHKIKKVKGLFAVGVPKKGKRIPKLLCEYFLEITFI
jgi:hypothetical protein